MASKLGMTDTNELPQKNRKPTSSFEFIFIILAAYSCGTVQPSELKLVGLADNEIMRSHNAEEVFLIQSPYVPLHELSRSWTTFSTFVSYTGSELSVPYNLYIKQVILIRAS